MFMRFVNLRVKDGRQRGLVQFFEDRVIPALGETDGCLYASLLQPSDDDLEFVSMTTWRSRESAEAYETSGLFDELLDESDDFLAEVSEGQVQSSAKAEGSFPTLQDPDGEA